MDKIILIHYINIDGVPNSNLGEMMEMVLLAVLTGIGVADTIILYFIMGWVYEIYLERK
jgi:hypothetical protein